MIRPCLYSNVKTEFLEIFVFCDVQTKGQVVCIVFNDPFTHYILINEGFSLVNSKRSI